MSRFQMENRTSCYKYLRTSHLFYMCMQILVMSYYSSTAFQLKVGFTQNGNMLNNAYILFCETPKSMISYIQLETYTCTELYAQFQFQETYSGNHIQSDWMYTGKEYIGLLHQISHQWLYAYTHLLQTYIIQYQLSFINI